ncbi:1,2-phenylacetyl-CoA epoxidase subunit PaaE [Corynebacterium vitaeruminis]|uniref:Phenylacetic acid degradation NADH oxidoreductase n=1 Tax=Corynebacterium vitaeruminis DSM 20294 TaxID=1224164 RepID=W5YAB9_9CORY|nr:1,2-phenylacetyl-CoA epoxidase subunit PaaE [Corynebacterium vitaeruminis]AHI23473.1 phenylacetic acid degradation NADH oxidoreductase [Corynebacterium vitaeruminis DSM 20294]
MTDAVAVKDAPEAPTKKRVSFNSLAVSELRNLTDDSVEVTFEVPADLVEDYDYIPGQYVALRATIDGQEVRRSYSICDVPRPGVIRVAIKKTFGGLFSTWANEELKVGDVIDVMNPQGAFTSKVHVTGLNNPEEVAAQGYKHIVAFAAGSGITPIMAIAQSFLAASEDNTLELVYANKGASDVMFAEELGDLKDRYPNRFAAHHVLSRENRINPLFTGRIDQEKLQTLLDKVLNASNVDEWFLCGPFDLVQLCRDTLSERGVDPSQVRYELFTTGEKPENNTGRLIVVDPGDEVYEISFHLDGLSGSIQSPVSAHETILNAALRSRPDVPYACAGGVCGTCRAKVTEGEFEMDENYALEPEEVEQGYVLTCQTRPKSSHISVDFDA